MANSIEKMNPVFKAWDVTPDDSTVFAFETTGIYVGVSGAVAVEMLDPLTGTWGSQTVVGLAAGVIHPIITKRVYATGTTAMSIVAVTT